MADILFKGLCISEELDFEHIYIESRFPQDQRPHPVTLVYILYKSSLVNS